MCTYCGCRELPLIIDLIAEHDEVTALGTDTIALIDRDDLAGARELLDRMAEALRSHWQGEEDGLFEAMRASDEYADYVAALVREHRELETLLATADLGVQQDREAITDAARGSAQHIRKEEDGLFPSSLTALDGAAWNRAIAAWQAAHPGSILRTQGS